MELEKFAVAYADQLKQFLADAKDVIDTECTGSGPEYRALSLLHRCLEEIHVKLKEQDARIRNNSCSCGPEN